MGSCAHLGHSFFIQQEAHPCAQAYNMLAAEQIAKRSSVVSQYNVGQCSLAKVRKGSKDLALKVAVV